MPTWNFEPGHTAAEFAVKHMMVSYVRGVFKNIEGSMNFDENSPEDSSVNIEIDASTIWSGDKDRDGHLKSADFLDVENHPKIMFTSTTVKKITDKQYEVAGDISIRGITKPTVLNVQYQGKWDTPFWVDNEDKGPITRVGFLATTTINRQDFGVSWNGTLDKGGVVVGNGVEITIDVEALLET